MNGACRLAIVATHPIQYFAPWFCHLARQPQLAVKVFYLWDFGVAVRNDPEFKVSLQWDIPLLDGYESEFVPNDSGAPGTAHFWGLNNPSLVDRLATWGPDAILLFGYRYASHLRVMLSRQLSPVPMLMRGDSHDLGRPRTWRTAMNRALRGLVFRRFEGFLAVGKANADYLRRAGVPGNRIHFVPHCVDNDRFAASALDACGKARWRVAVGIRPEARVVLFAGKLMPEKRPLDLLMAYIRVEANLVARGSSAVLLFVGSGALEGELRAAAGERIGRTVFFIPFQNQSEMPAVYSACDLLVLPSVNETWGLAVNEAMSVGTPVIVSDRVGCHLDLIAEGVTGWTFPAGSIDRLAALLIEVLQDPTRLADAGAAARSLVADYSYEAATAKLLEAVEAVLRRRSDTIAA